MTLLLEQAPSDKCQEPVKDGVLKSFLETRGIVGSDETQDDGGPILQGSPLLLVGRELQLRG